MSEGVYYRRTSTPAVPSQWRPGATGVTWARFAKAGPRTLLLAAHGPDGFSVLCYTEARKWSEVVAIPSLSLRYGTTIQRRLGRVSSAALLEGHVLALLVDTTVLFLSLDDLALLSTLDIEGHVRAHDIKANGEHVVVSMSAPGGLRVYRYSREGGLEKSASPHSSSSSSSSLTPPFSIKELPCSPITDVALNPADLSPVFDLGKGGRFLAYTSHSSSLSHPVPAAMCTSIDTLDDSVDPLAGIAQHAPLSKDYDAPQLAVGHGIVSGPGLFEADAFSRHSPGYSPPLRKMGENVMSGFRSVHSYVSASRSVPSSSYAFADTSPRLPSGDSFPGGAFLDALPYAVVVVVDLKLRPAHPLPSDNGSQFATRPRVVSLFRPYAAAVGALSFSPSSAYLLVSPAHSHHADVFEIRSPSPSAFSKCNSDDDDGNGPVDLSSVWHRYRLQRGYTSAVITMVSWESDGKFVALGTGKHGTVHVFAVTPYGGAPPSLTAHFERGVTNARTLQGLSVKLSPVCRIRISPDDSGSPIPTDALGYYGGYPSPARPPPLVYPALEFVAESPEGEQDVLVFYPNMSKVVLKRLYPETEEAGRTGTGLTLSANRSLASNLTQTMRAIQKAPVSDVHCRMVSEWPISLETARDAFVPIQQYTEEGHQSNARTDPASEVEIETFSRSPWVVPRSIYQSHQFSFYKVDDDYEKDLAKGHLDFVEYLERVQVRPDVEVKISDEQDQNTTLSTILRNEHLDDEEAEEIRHVEEYKPNFPNGVPGKYGYWRDCLGRPLMSSNTVFNEKLGRVKKELIDGVVKQVQRLDLKLPGRDAEPVHGDATYVVASDGDEAVGNSNGVPGTASVSFEDDDVLFAEYEDTEKDADDDYDDFEEHESENEHEEDDEAEEEAAPYIPFEDDDFDRL